MPCNNAEGIDSDRGRKRDTSGRELRSRITEYLMKKYVHLYQIFLALSVLTFLTNSPI